MKLSHTHGSAAASGGLAAAICMAITQIIWLVIGSGALEALAIGASLSCIAFGATYASTYFVARARLPQREQRLAASGRQA